MTGLIDVCPTILHLAAVDSPEAMHGRSLQAVLGGDETGWRHAIMAEYHGDEIGLYSQRMIRRGQHKLIFNSYDVRELYDLEADPAELTNLAYDPSYRELRLDLEAELCELMVASDDPLCRTALNVLG